MALSAPNPDNRNQIIRLIRREKQISRVEIAEQIGLSRSALTAIANELINAGYVREVSTTDTSGTKGGGRGRPRQALALNPSAGYVIGIKLSLHQLCCVVSDFSGEPIFETTRDFNGNMPPLKSIILIDECVQEALSKTGLKESQVLRMCVGIPGYVSHASGICHWSPVFDRRDVDFAALMNAHFTFDCIIENDTNLATLAEFWFGVGRGLGTFCVVSIEHGVGMGLVVNGEIYRGHNGVGPEFGHSKLIPDGRPCRCGQNGCVEAYVADYAILRQLDSGMSIDDYVQDPGGHHKKIVEATEAALAGDIKAAAAIKEAGSYLGKALGNLIATLNPATIIITGDATRRKDLFFDATKREAKAAQLVGDEFNTSLILSGWGDNVWARGATALALRVTYSEIADFLAGQRTSNSA